MVQVFAERYNKVLASLFLSLFYSQFVTAAYVQIAFEPVRLPAFNNRFSKSAQRDNLFKQPLTIGKRQDNALRNPHAPQKTTPHKVDIGGPTQPEMQSFQSVNSNNMVDLFSGDFSYNIPLLDVAGYPVNISYHSGVTMDQEASWVGLGWNINPGAVTRNMRGLPDDFNGTDSVTKTMSIKPNKTAGVTLGNDVEITGIPSGGLNAGLGTSIGIMHNNYRGWGLETGLNASLGAGAGSKGTLTAGLSLMNSSQDGMTITPSFSAKSSFIETGNNQFGGNIGISLPYNSRSGLKSLQVSGGLSVSGSMKIPDKDNDLHTGSYNKSLPFSSSFSFVNPTYTPSIEIPYTNNMFTFTGRYGVETKIISASEYISGYVSKQTIADADKTLSLPAYGYLNYQNAAGKQQVLLDFNREKDIPYREKPALPTIAVPSYTYDAFTITGEGTGGMFRAYRSDIGYMHDPTMRTRDNSAAASADLAVGDVAHAGADLNLTYAYTQTGAWTVDNPLAGIMNFQQPNGLFEASYFRNPGEKTVNSKAFYNAIGGDDVVTADIYQSQRNDPLITSTGKLRVYRNKSLKEITPTLTAAGVKRQQRDKRGQVISYLTAEEAGVVGLNKYIENYTLNRWSLQNCGDVTIDNVNGDGAGLLVEYFAGRNFEQKKSEEKPLNIQDIDNSTNLPAKGIGYENCSIRWSGRLKPETTGNYIFQITSDDGARLFINDSLIINAWTDHSSQVDTGSANLVAGELYNIRLEFYNHGDDRVMKFRWSYQNGAYASIPAKDLYMMPAVDTFMIPPYLSKEKRVNSFRKPNHISEIDVLNPDGRKYVYGLPVYNLKQREATFSVDPSRASLQDGMVKYTAGTDDSTTNKQGNENYFNAEDIPAYAHSFLLTGIMSPDYVDITGDGISDDDLGDAVKFTYSKVNGIKNPFGWRAPYVDSASYNEGLRTDGRDDKGSYTYGEKEMWYLHSIESKNMIAAFIVSDRKDMLAINRAGIKDNVSHYAKKLDSIKLFTKAAFLKDGIYAKPVKTVHFEYTYELCMKLNGNESTDSGKLTLKKIWFTYNGNNKGVKNPYVFVYNSKNPTYNVRSYDRWGSYKDPLQNPSSTTSNLITNSEYPYALQDSTLAAQNAAAWTLDSIVLPSGGRMKITYESDDYAYVQNRRAMQMMRIVGFSMNQPSNVSDLSNNLYSATDPLALISQDHLFVGIRVPRAVSSNQEVYQKYLENIQRLYFKLYVKMPSDKFGSGYEFVPGYAAPDFAGGYGFLGSGDVIWLKLKGINLSGEGDGNFSPVAKTAIQFLRLNLPSKAYPGSDTGDDFEASDAVKILLAQVTNMMGMFASFDGSARAKNWARKIDTSRSFIRINNPEYKKYGGGLRVKRITIYDHWNSMTKQKEAVYGQEYTYTTTKEINGVATTISSGVATYEPMLGGEENPWHNPIEYNQQVAPLAPVAMGYVEEPMGESFFPGASVGYSKVKVRSINTVKKKSANGFAETGFFTSYDFPTIVDRTVIDDNTKKRFKPALSTFLRINARHFLTVSQGYKIELNDMNGKTRYQATYAETDSVSPISYTENFYKIDNSNDEFKHLNNTVMAIQPNGTIDTAAIIGKDAELMMDMREQQSVTNGNNFSVNVDFFTFSVPPVLAIPSFLAMPQREENRYRSVATTKVIQRYGILDSIIAIDKGSKIVTENLLYDAETGDVVLTRTQNEFNDSVFNFTYPAHWAYNNMGGAYQNISAVFDHLTIMNGKLIGGSIVDSMQNYFTGGDELLAYTKVKTGGTDCAPLIAKFPIKEKLWVVDTSLYGGARNLFFIDEDGKPFTGNDVSLKITKSGRKNLGGTVGTVSLLSNPVVKADSNYTLKIDSTQRILNAGAAEYKQVWRVAEQKKQNFIKTCVPPSYLPMFKSYMENLLGYMSNWNKMALSQSDNVTVRDLVNTAISYGLTVDTVNCQFIKDNLDGPFYMLPTSFFTPFGSIYSVSSFEPGDVIYRAQFGSCIIRLVASSSQAGYTDEWSSFTSDKLQYIWTGDDSDTIRFSFAAPGACHSYTYGYCPPMAYLEVESCNDCNNIVAGVCYNPITDSATNPYKYGIVGNIRPEKSYVYYSERAETDPGVLTNIRTNGTIPSFMPFWKFQGNGVVPQYDTSRWVWNARTTLFNKRGLEMENTDPLGRYNAGLYGYDQALAVAVTQNARYREAAFDGFEDYGFGMSSCYSTCSVGRHLDFSSNASNFDNTQSHTGRYSLRVDANSSIGIAAPIAAIDNNNVSLNFNTKSISCTATPVLDGILTTAQTLLPVFSPIPSSKLLISTWVKEAQSCNCATYTNSQLIITITTATGNVSRTAKPSGNIIDGWQRIEDTISVPANATNLSLGFVATSDSAVYFDDVRVLPFNANMKSFVYDKNNLRLMAELDENNYATFYEYDDDGTLIRVKKETERGVKTIKETRSALLKETVQ
jgi:hypothetical protein